MRRTRVVAASLAAVLAALSAGRGGELAERSGAPQNAGGSQREGAPIGDDGDTALERYEKGEAPPAMACCEPISRDPELAVREEFERLRATGTREALIHFIARHPQHSLAEDASALLGAPGSVDEAPQPGAGAAYRDSHVYSAFDKARQQNTAQAYEIFVERFGPHPLAERAQRLRDMLP